MSSKSPARRSLRRIWPARHKRLERRERSELPEAQDLRVYSGLLLDTTVYIDDMQGRLSLSFRDQLRSANLWHSTVTECGLSVLAGLLDPKHLDSSRVIEQMVSSIELRPAHRVVNPDREVWREAGIVAGLLARLQQYGKAEQRKVLNDALILLSAAKAGLTVLTRNVSDFDLLTQLLPHTKAVFYEVE